MEQNQSRPGIFKESVPYHTGVERIVKKVTEAAAHVYSHERRDGYVRSHEVSAELMARNRSKQDLVNLVKFRRPGE